MEEQVEGWLDAVRMNIEPTEAQRSQASTSQTHLRERLNEGRFGRRIVSDFIGGSFGRHTAIRPIDDVDLIFVIEPMAWDVPLFADKPDPAQLLESVRGVVKRRYPKSGTKIHRRSVRLSLSHIDVDVVPAVQGDGNAVWIPDKNLGKWIASNPLKHAEDAEAMNQACFGRGKPLIKLLKAWNARLPSTCRMKSFFVETLAIRILGEEAPATFVDGMLCYWDRVVGLAGGECEFAWATEPKNVQRTFFGKLILPDAVGRNIAEKLPSTDFEKFARQARTSRDSLAAALRARTDKTARSHFAKVF